MDKYGQFSLIESFTYRGTEVELFKAFKGRRHCKEQHAFDERKCKACGAKLSPRLVYIIRIGDQPVEEDFNDIAHAVEFAKYYIDGLRDGPEQEPEPPDERSAAAPPGRRGSREKLVAMAKKLGWGKKLAARARKASPPKKP